LILALGSVLAAASAGTQSPARASGCSTIVVGKKASQTGEVLLGHNEDNEGRVVVASHLMPRLKHQPGEMIVLEKGRAKIPQVAETAGFFWSETIASWPASFSDSFLNEWGVAVVSDSCWPSKEKQGDLTEGGIGYGLRRIIAERARTAREGVESAAAMLQKYGYSDSGRTYVIADRNEAWMLEVVMGKHFAARRVADDEVAYIPNYYTIHKVNLNDKQNFMASPGLISYAIQRGWYAPAKSGDFRDFDFKKAFMSPEYYDTNWEVTKDPQKDYNILRQKHALEMIIDRSYGYLENFPFAVKPAKKIGLEDMMKILRTHYEGTADYMTTSPKTSPHSLCTICASETQESLIIQFRDNPQFTVIWKTCGRPCTSPYVPWYLGIQRIPAGYSLGDPIRAMANHFNPTAENLGYNPGRAWWTFVDIQNIAEPQYRQGETIKEIQKYRDALEEEFLKEQARLEAQAYSLDDKNHQEAMRYLTDYTSKQAGKTWDMARRICQKLAAIKIEVQPKEISKSSPQKTISAAILANPDFEAGQVDPSTAVLGPGYVRMDKWAKGNGRVEDVNKDGRPDLVVTFRAEDVLSQAVPCRLDLWLCGKTRAGRIFVAKDVIVVTDF
jgi:dipeptidase